MSDVTRIQFNESNRVSKKIFQKGTILADADINEQTDILTTRDRRMLSSIIGHASKRFGDGLKVVGTGASLSVSIKAGFAALIKTTNYAILFELGSDTTLSGFITWTESRTDYVFIDIHEVEYDSTDDANIINPTIGQETAVDYRLEYAFGIHQVTLGSPAEGWTRIGLATVTKSSGSNIEAGDVTLTISDFYATTNIDTENLIDGAVTTPKIEDNAVISSKILNGAVTSNELAEDSVKTIAIEDAAVTSGKIANGAVNGSHIALNSIDSTMLATNAVQTPDITNDAVTAAKINPDVAGDGLAQEGTGALTVTGIDQVGYELQCKTVDIGNWNMDESGQIAGNEGGISKSAIIMIQIVIISDDGDLYDILMGGYWCWDSNLKLYRNVGGQFDNTSFDNPSFNRGWITIWFKA
jgi:hypothetical protein